jgi:Dolichyl-phosphate-mannose-protein mannosyltransferase
MTYRIQPFSVTELAQTRIEVWFRRLLITFSTIAAIAVLSRLGMIFWAQNEFTQPESIVAAQSMMLAKDGTLYYGLNSFPHTIAAYTPIFYCLEAGLYKLGLPGVLAARLLSFVSMVGLIVLSWRLVILYTRDRYCARIAALLCASTAIITSWGSVGQVDTMAIFWAVAAFYQFSRYYMRRENTLVWAFAFAVLAFFTKQTMVASPAAMFVLLCFDRPKTALRFGAGLAAVIIGLALVINAASSGRFLSDTVLANLNPFALEKISEHGKYALIAAGQLIIVVGAGASRALRGYGRALFVYLGTASAVLAVTAPKIGSDLNYQVEPTVVLILCGCVALSSLNFFELCFRGSKSWVTLLQVPLLLHVVLNDWITAANLLGRISKEQQFRSQLAAIRPYFADGGRVISTDVNAMARLRGRIEVEPLIYKLLAAAGAVDPEPLRRELAAESFSTIILFEDAGHPDPNQDAEIPTLPPTQIQEIQKHYKLVDHIPGPYLNGVYIYKPAGAGVR